MQNQFEQPLLNLYVRQERHVVSYLTPLTGYVFGHGHGLQSIGVLRIILEGLLIF
jgi:hypothetical protein